MIALDEMAYSSPLRHWPPLGKLLLCLALLLGSLFAVSPPVPILVLLIGTALLYKSTKFRLPSLLVMAYLNTLLILFISVAIIAFLQPGTPFWGGAIGPLSLTLTKEGLNLSILLLLRVLAGFSVLFFFASSTPIPHLFTALRQVRVPEQVAELTVLVYRYSFLMLEQFGQMTTAADCRLGFRNAGTTLRTISKLFAGLFGRSLDFAERAQAALYCRAFQGSFPTFRQPARLTPAWLIASLSIFVVLRVFAFFTSGWLLIK